MIVTSCKSCRFWRTPRKAWYEDNLSGLPISVEGGGGGKGGGVSSRNHEDCFSISRVTKNKISFSRFLEAQKRNKV